MNQDAIEARFAALNLRIAQVDAQVAIARQAVARLESTFERHAEHAAATEQAMTEGVGDIRKRVERLESGAAVATVGITHLATVTADENGEHPGDGEAAAGSLPWVLSEDSTKWTATLPMAARRS